MSDFSAKALTVMPKGILFGLIKTKFSSKAGFPVLMAIIKINYEKDLFSLQLRNDELKKVVKGTDKISEFSDIADTLLMKVKKRISAEKIDRINLTIDIKNKSTEADVYFQQIKDGKPDFMFINLKQVF